MAITEECVEAKTGGILIEAGEEETTNTHVVDTLREKEFIRDELAIDIISCMVGYTATELLKAERKNDLPTIALLRQKFSLYRKEQLEVYSGNISIKEKCIREYAPILKQRFELLKKSMAESKV